VLVTNEGKKQLRTRNSKKPNC